jgi:hypothetical protein
VEVTESGLQEMFAAVLPLLDERQRRLLAGAQARALGHGGIGMVARTAGLSRTTVSAALAEVREGPAPSGRVRAPGAGRPSLTSRDPELLERLDALVEPGSRGDPMCPLRWTSKSTSHLAQALTAAGHPVSPDTVGRLLTGLGYSLQATAKQLEGSQHADRDAQFGYLAERVAEFLSSGDPVISVDSKKKELIGQKANRGREYQPTGRPERVDVHDFPDPAIGKAIPYGVYDIAANEGFVVVGSDHETASFAAATIGRWWDLVGCHAYPAATRLLITADAGGSNSYRARLWKVELGRLAARTGITITVCHLPPGTSKWNKIEHRLFSAITLNWRGRPLTSHEVVVDLIGATTNTKGLKVHAHRDHGSYPLGIKITKDEVTALPITPHDFHGEWNYTVHPHRPGQQTTTM